MVGEFGNEDLDKELMEVEEIMKIEIRKEGRKSDEKEIEEWIDEKSKNFGKRVIVEKKRKLKKGERVNEIDYERRR